MDREYSGSVHPALQQSCVIGRPHSRFLWIESEVKVMSTAMYGDLDCSLLKLQWMTDSFWFVAKLC